MKYFFILLTVLATVNRSVAQSGEDSVKAVINKMFAAMKAADPIALKECFADSMVLQTISRSREGKVVVQNEDAKGFVEFISKETAGNADERISFETIRIDGPLAIAWTPYNFYYKGQFSHCGVNSFQLVRFEGGWKIQYIIDTRRRAGCDPK
jgi:hypothetical protein